MMIDLSEVSLEAQFHHSASPNSPTFVLSHPYPVYGGSMTNKVIDQIYRRCVERDWSVVSYNMRGVGKSAGKFDKGIGEEKDLSELVQWTLNQPNTNADRLLLIGYSFGSWLTAKVAAKLQKPCILIAPPVTMYPFPQLSSSSKVIFSAQKDELIDPVQIEKYFESLPDPKQFVSILDADHYFIGSTTELIRQVFQTIDQIGI